MGHSKSRDMAEIEALINSLVPHNDLEERTVMEELEEERTFLKGEILSHRKLTPVEKRVIEIERAVADNIVSGVPVEETKRRMWRNWNYDPGGYIEWNDDCHPFYALMGEDEKTGRMWKTAMVYGFKGWRQSRDWNIAHIAAQFADRLKARYCDWCLCQVIANGRTGLHIALLTGKRALKEYYSWVRSGKKIPESVRLLLLTMSQGNGIND